MMTRRRRSFGFASALLAALAGASSAQQREISFEEQEILLRLTQQFNEARSVFEDPQRESQSIEFFTQIVREIDDQKRQREEIAGELLELQQRALELRARASFNSGQLQGAADDFRRLILDNPRHQLDTEGVSPKIVDFFEDQKKQLVGFIAVNSEPAGARVTVNGDFVGVTNFFPVEVLTGAARVEVNREGYEVFVREDVRILPGEITTLDVELVRNSARLEIITQPTGVEVLLDGEVIGRTGGTLPPYLRSFIPPGLDPDAVSAPLELPAIPLGEHLIELRKDCYEPARLRFEAEEPKDYTALIEKLEESVGQLQVSSNPSGSRVFLDGEYKGNTPLSIPRVCSGTHRLEVKHDTGKYLETIDVAKNEVLSLDCPIRPSVAFLGVVAADGVPGRDVEDIREKVRDELGKLEAMNLILPDPAELETILGPQGLLAMTARSSAPAAPAVGPEEIRELSEKAARALGVEALLVAYVPQQRFTKDVVFHLVAEGSPAPDAHTVNYLEGLSDLLDRLSAPTPLFGSWIGLSAVDTRLGEGPIVLGVEPEGPAARAGIAVGDVILEAAGEPVRSARDLVERVERSSPGDRFPIGVSREGASRETIVEIGETPVQIPLNQRDFLYNKAIVDLRHRIVADPSHSALARLNLALAHMQLGDYETALREHLPQVTLDGTRGISQGTVYYYQGVCYQMLGERAEAARMFQQALSYEEATLQSNDGPRVAPLAQRRLREIGQ